MILLAVAVRQALHHSRGHSSSQLGGLATRTSMSHAKPYTDSIEVFNQPLKQGVKIPRIGLGVFQSAPGPETEEAVACALQEGYRHIDTAALYRNEASVGKRMHIRAIMGCLLMHHKRFSVRKGAHCKSATLTACFCLCSQLLCCFKS